MKWKNGTVVLMGLAILIGLITLDEEKKTYLLSRSCDFILNTALGAKGSDWCDVLFEGIPYAKICSSTQEVVQANQKVLEENHVQEDEELLEPENEIENMVEAENQNEIPTNPKVEEYGSTYVDKLRKTQDVHYLWDHFYIVDSTTSVTKKQFRVKNMLECDLQLPPQSGKKQILIYHTHGASEHFSDSKKGVDEDSVIGVGDVLAQELEKNGYGVYHDRTKYDWINGGIDRSKAYNESLEGMQKILKENPDIQVTIDLHRDSIGKNRHTYTVIDGKKTALVMLFNGMSRTRLGKIAYLNNPNLEGNLSFSLQLKCYAMEQYEGLMKPIYLKGYRYNLHLVPRALLIELGNENNTVEEAKNAAAPLAKVIAGVLKGENKIK